MTSDESPMPNNQIEVAGDIERLREKLRAEQNTTRRVMLSFISVFLFVLLVILALFLYAGIHMLRNSEGTVEMISDIRADVALNTFETSGLSNRLTAIEGTQMRLLATASSESTTRAENDETIREDLRRINKWIAVNEANEERLVQKQQEWINALDVAVDDMQAQVATLGAQFEEWVASGQIITAVGEETTSTSTDSSGDTADDSAQEPLLPAEPLSAEEVEGMFAEELNKLDEPTVYEKANPSEIRVITLPNGDRYEGEFEDGLMEGWGTYYYRNGDRYEGRFSRDMKNGVGILETSLGERYDGGFKDGMKHGRGRLVMVDGSRYAGDFKDDMIIGEGVMFYADGSRYAGGVVNGVKNGKGVLRFHNGDIYQGEFRKELRTGRGSYTFADGGRYVGEFVNGRRDGQGHYIYPGGEEYLGAFKKGKKHGIGLRIYPDGTRIRGVWSEDSFVRNIKQ